MISMSLTESTIPTNELFTPDMIKSNRDNFAEIRKELSNITHTIAMYNSRPYNTSDIDYNKLNKLNIKIEEQCVINKKSSN